MAVRHYSTSITVPAGIPSTAPVSQKWVTEDNIVLDVEVEIPPGHNGQTGIRVNKGDVQLLPWGGAQWIIANDYDKVFEINDYLPTGDVTISAYNTGQFPHTFYLRMSVQDYTGGGAGGATTEGQALNFVTPAASADLLSPDQLIGAQTASDLTNGLITADDVIPSSPGALAAPVPPPALTQ